jgi:hypothetical protein
MTDPTSRQRWRPTGTEQQLSENKFRAESNIWSQSGFDTLTYCLTVGCNMTSTSVAKWLRLTLSKEPNWVDVCLPSHEARNRSSFRNVVLSSISNSGRWTKSSNPMILNIIHHRQNPLDSAVPNLIVQKSGQSQCTDWNNFFSSVT